MESYDHEGFNNTKFQENPRGSCQKVVEMIWNDPIAMSMCVSTVPRVSTQKINFYEISFSAT